LELAEQMILLSGKKLEIQLTALKNGAIGGKITGAGGGGHMLFYCEKPKQKNLEKKLQTLGLKRVKFSFYNNGTKIIQTPDLSNF